MPTELSASTCLGQQRHRNRHVNWAGLHNLIALTLRLLLSALLILVLNPGEAFMPLPLWFPILVINGRNDTSSPIPVVESYMIRLRMAGKPVELYLPENGPHGFYFGRPDIPEWKESARRCIGTVTRAPIRCVRGQHALQLPCCSDWRPSPHRSK